MKSPSQAGLKVLRSFDRRADDQFDINQQRLRNIHVRSGLRSVNVYRVVEALEKDGYLSKKYGFEGYWYSITPAGRAALR